MQETFEARTLDKFPDDLIGATILDIKTMNYNGKDFLVLHYRAKDNENYIVLPMGQTNWANAGWAE